MKKHSENDLLKIIKTATVLSSQKIVAKHAGVSVQYINDIIHGRRPISDRIANELGFERITYFVEVKK